MGFFDFITFCVPDHSALPEGIHCQKEAALDSGDGDFAGFGMAGVDTVSDFAESRGIADRGEGGHVEGCAEVSVSHFTDPAATVDAGAGLQLPDIQPCKAG